MSFRFACLTLPSERARVAAGAELKIRLAFWIDRQLASPIVMMPLGFPACLLLDEGILRTEVEVLEKALFVAVEVDQPQDAKPSLKRRRCRNFLQLLCFNLQRPKDDNKHRMLDSGTFPAPTTMPT
jgi:hypothetical protein